MGATSKVLSDKREAKPTADLVDLHGRDVPRSGTDGFTGYQPTSGRDVEPPATPANKQDSVLFPSVGVNAAGKAVIAFSVAGEDFFPRAAYEQ